MWLDELPVEVCERIVRNMLIEWTASTYIYGDIVELSHVSGKQKLAAQLAVPNHMIYSMINNPVDGFNELLAPSLQFLSLGRPVCSLDEPLFRAPHIQSVAMQLDDSDTLNVLAGSSSLRQLNLLVSSTGVSWEELVNCLQTLRLTQLVLQYGDTYSNCPCVPEGGPSSTCNEKLEALLSALPDLKSLAIRCPVHAPDYTEQVVKRILQLPQITQINVVSSVSSVPSERLQELHNVIVDDYTDNQFESALELGNLLTHFFATRISLDCDQLAQLRNCKHLKAMSIALEQGAEADLGDLVRMLPHLQSIEAVWYTKTTEDEECFPMRSSYAAFPGAIRRAVEAGKKLRELKVCNATIDAFELEHILQSLGKRLLSLTVTISYLDLKGYACLQRCLDSILKYNPSLNKLGIKWQGYKVLHPFHAKNKHRGPILKILKTARCVYVRNMLPRLPYFLVALKGYYTLAFEYLGGIAVPDDESDYPEEEDTGSHDSVMEE